MKYGLVASKDFAEFLRERYVSDFSPSDTVFCSVYTAAGNM